MTHKQCCMACLGLRVRELSALFYARVLPDRKERILATCEELLQAGSVKERTLAFDWAYRQRKSFTPEDFLRLRSWLEPYVRSWSACDDLCIHALGCLLERFPQLVPQAIPWTGSANRWIRRVSAVCVIFSLRRGHALADALKVADVLLLDPDIMVQKGYGWMLKEATRSFLEPVMDFVMRHRREMPRTALRYAIEKLPPD